MRAFSATVISRSGYRPLTLTLSRRERGRERLGAFCSLSLRERAGVRVVPQEPMFASSGYVSSKRHPA